MMLCVISYRKQLGSRQLQFGGYYVNRKYEYIVSAPARVSQTFFGYCTFFWLFS